MKKLIAVCLVCVLTTAAWGQIINISFDENGNGSVNDDGNVTPLPYFMDDTLGWYVTPPSLSYELPLNYYVFNGSVEIYEPGTQNLSDLLIFHTIADNNGIYISSRLYVFSDNSDGADALADTGIPTFRWENIVSVTEEGSENGWNGVHYTPIYSGIPYVYPEPGNSSAGTITYNFTSDVPEPATICLLGLGALSLLRSRKRKV